MDIISRFGDIQSCLIVILTGAELCVCGQQAVRQARMGTDGDAS